MDLVYLSDNYSYSFPVHLSYKNNDSWVDINYQPEKDKKERQEKQPCTRQQKTCSICKNKQKRALAHYIMKTRRDSDRDTFNEEEEEEVEGEIKANNTANQLETKTSS